MDLSTRYLGMQLRTPLVVSASPLSHEISGIRNLEDAGASAVVLYSLFEEQLHKEALELELHLNAGTESFAESLTYFPGGLVSTANMYTGATPTLVASASESVGSNGMLTGITDNYNGSALNNFGVRELLHGVAELAPQKARHECERRQAREDDHQ